ncbi:tail fiber assembly protein [Burkholderia phage vB_BglM_WTB]
MMYRTNEEIWFVLETLYPGVSFGADCTLYSRVDERGNQISDPIVDKWTRPEPKPSTAFLCAQFVRLRPKWDAKVAAFQASQRVDKDIEFARHQIDHAEDIGDEQAARQWRYYRAGVRTVPKQAGFPMNITWPIRPKEVF